MALSLLYEIYRQTLLILSVPHVTHPISPAKTLLTSSALALAGSAIDWPSTALANPSFRGCSICSIIVSSYPLDPGPSLPRPTSRLAASRPCMSNLVSSPPPLVIPSPSTILFRTRFVIRLFRHPGLSYPFSVSSLPLSHTNSPFLFFLLLPPSLGLPFPPPFSLQGVSSLFFAVIIAVVVPSCWFYVLD